MQRSKIENFHHLVWETHRREPLVAPRIEREVFGCIRAEVERLKCQTLALNGMPDHVHLVVRVHSTLAIACLAQAVKGVSSQMVNANCSLDRVFKCQECYASFSLSRPHLDRAIGYVNNQKQHHNAGQIWPEWEETELEVDSVLEDG